MMVVVLMMMVLASQHVARNASETARYVRNSAYVRCLSGASLQGCGFRDSGPRGLVQYRGLFNLILLE